MSAPTNAYVAVSGPGAPDVIVTHRGQPVPEPGRGEVRIRVEASSVQYTDTLIRRGIYVDVTTVPGTRLGYDLIGRIDAVGDGVEGWGVGDRVADLVTVGGNSVFLVRPATGLVRVPEALDAAEAVDLVLSWMTAYQILHRHARATPGQRVFCIGGNGAVGRALIALGRLAGVEVWVTAGERHRAELESAGARVFPRDGWLSQVRDAGGVDVAVDGVCLDGFRTAYAALRPGGQLVAIGASNFRDRPFWQAGVQFGRMFLWNLWPDRRRSGLYSITRLRKQHPEWFREDLEALFALLADGAVHPVIGERIGFDGVVDAHRRLEDGGLTGKLVLVVSP